MRSTSMFPADPNQADEWQVLVVGRASEEQCESEDVVLGVGEPSIGRDIAEFAESPICTPSNEQPALALPKGDQWW